MKGNFFSSDGGTCFGLGGLNELAEDKFAIRFDTFTGAPATGSGNVAQQTTDESQIETIAVFVVRRDDNNVIYIHDTTGVVVSTITSQVAQSPVINQQAGKIPPIIDPTSLNASGRTDGSLGIKNFGQGLGADEPKFSGHIGRFGVIQKDIGTERAAKLATDLHSLYKPIS